MVSRSVIKLIDEAVIPATCLIIAKMLGLFLISFLLHLNFTVEYFKILKILPTVHFVSLQDYIIAENYSNLAMFVAVALGTIYVIIKAHYFHSSHIHPKFQAKLVSLNFEKFIDSSYHLYHQAAIWLVFLWLTIGFLAISSYLKVTYLQISVVAFILAANFSWILALDIEKEIEINKGN